jgi:uncharacterized protein YyaL (SSP411 family)
MSNDLEKETSPYLMEHHDTAINWYYWNEESLLRSKKENKAIFLFIGSSTSHWSEVMEEKSFLDQNVIKLLNEHFIPILVDKNERPDIERYYQKVYLLMNRQSAGSPLTLFLTKDLEPFYAASYIPQQDVDAQLGLEALLRIISKKYSTDNKTLVEKGKEVLTYVNPQEQSIQATKLTESIRNTIEVHAQNLIEKEFGGFSKAPKFSNVSTLELLLDCYTLNHDIQTLNIVTLTLNQMSKGGFFDLKNGGFYSYSEDEAWSKPSKMKTSYDNALLAQLYLKAYHITGDTHYKDIAFKTLDFLLGHRDVFNLISLAHESTITSWNALLVNALFSASTIDKKYQIKAIENLEGILSQHYVNGSLYHTKNVKAFLEDYAYLGETLVIAYQHTLDESFLIMATQFSNLLIEQFYQQGRWIYVSNRFKLREEIYDTQLPSSLSIALSLLMSVSSLVDNNYKKFVFKTLELHSYNLMRQPLSSPKLSQIVLRYLKDDIVIKSNLNLLKENIDKRERIRYPFVLFKITVDEKLQLFNSHSLLATEDNFETLITHIESN